MSGVATYPADRDAERRDYARLYFELCDCAGPQPSLDNPKLDEHAPGCPYRVAVECRGGREA